MLHRTRWSATLVAVCVMFMVGCSDGGSAGPTEPDRPAIPVLATNVAVDAPLAELGTCQCALWSCSWNDCQQDPGQYGACCVACADEGEPAEPQPSCEGPPPQTYCQLYSGRCTDGPPCDVAPGYCYNAYATRAPNLGPSACYDRVATDPVFAQSINSNCHGITWDFFPACFSC